MNTNNTQINITEPLRQAILTGMQKLAKTQDESISVGEEGMVLVKKGSLAETDRKNTATYLGDFADTNGDKYVLYAA